ncbi:hypothetical protein LI142_13550 [Eubacterium limosum]|uniref:hypothetical protein n=1 Tax=Eubacterium limosum TaxID=1736 RepID=UPI001D0657BA|nr:hypothetical protein [Eubacterium limosum]MCB6570524.1 hypothetical protein [Eubacterium limosum]
MADKNALNNKMKVLSKLFSAGCNTEKQLQELKIEDILSIPGITVQEMKEITELQKQVKNKTLFSYLGGVTDGNTES